MKITAIFDRSELFFDKSRIPILIELLKSRYETILIGFEGQRTKTMQMFKMNVEVLMILRA